jgi:hypothetical protein
MIPLLFLFNDAYVGILPGGRLAPSLRALSFHPTPACAASRLGVYAELLDLERLPLLWPRYQTLSQGSAHEREGDFSAFLYEESGRLYVFDQGGPLCLTRFFYGASGKLADDEELGFFENSTLHIEVDGVEVLAASADNLFSGAHGDVLPRSLLTALRPHFARGGNVILAPICAQERLRLSWALPFSPSTARLVPPFDIEGPRQAMQQADECISSDSECFLKVYSDSDFLRLPGSRLPPSWDSFDGMSPALPPAALESLGLPPPSSPLLFSGLDVLARIQRGAEEKGAEAGRLQQRCSELNAAAPRHVLFSSTSGSGGGTVLALIVEFSDERHALELTHSRDTVLEGVWDGPEGGLFRTDLSSLFGPSHLGYGTDRVPTLPSAQLAFGTLGSNGTTRGFYFSLPAPFWRSAEVTLTIVPKEGGEQLPVHLCSKVFATSGLPGSSSSSSSSEGVQQGCPPAGYLQSATHDFFVTRAKENPLLEVQGLAGKLVAVTNFLEARRGVYTTSVVEGDIRVWVDNCSSPKTWNSGYEDFFNGAHTYQWGSHRVAEPFFAHQRRDTERWMLHASARCIEEGRGGCSAWKSKLHPDTDLFSARIFALDAVPFHDSLGLFFEGFSGDYEMAQCRGVAIFYGRRLASQPPRVVDTMHPAVEAFKSPAARAHGYRLEGSIRGALDPALERYDLISAFAGAGEPLDVADGSCPIRNTGHGASGADYHSCPAPLLSLPIFALPTGTKVHFSLAVDPLATFCALRRVLDAAYSVQRAELFVEGTFIQTLLSSERAFTHLNTRLREVDIFLQPEVTAGRDRIEVTLAVELDGSAPKRSYPLAQLGEAWTEARWRVLCFYH